MMDRTSFTPGEVGISPPLDLPALERLHLLHALLDDKHLPERLRLPSLLRQALLAHARALLGVGTREETRDPPMTGVVSWTEPDLGPHSEKEPHPDAELLALGAEMEALGELLRAWPDDPAAERADARLAAVELEITALVPCTGAGLAVKLRLACELWAAGDSIEQDGDGPLPDGHERACLLWSLGRVAKGVSANVT